MKLQTTRTYYVEVPGRFEFEKKNKGERERNFATKSGFPISQFPMRKYERTKFATVQVLLCQFKVV